MNYFEILYKKYNKVCLTKKEAEAELGLSQATFNRRLKEGDFLKYTIIGGTYLFPLKAFVYKLELAEKYSFLTAITIYKMN